MNTLTTPADTVIVDGEPIPECRRAPQLSKAERTAAGIRSVIEDLYLDLPGVDVRPILADRLERLAREVENLSSRDLLRTAPLAITPTKADAS